MTDKKNLYLFDINGTLLDVVQLHLKAWQEAYKELFGLTPPPETFTEKFGIPEKQSHEIICEELGINLTAEVLEELLLHRASTINAEIDAGNIETLPGVYDFLNGLKERNEIIGIVTGNPESTGRKLLLKSRLLPYFKIQSYCEDSVDRTEIARRAILEGKEKQYQFDKVVVIGDTPSDVEAGKSVGAYTVAVATGHKTKEELQLTGADLTLNSLLEYKKIIEALSLT